MSKCCNKPLLKRIILSTILGIASGFLCVYLASTNNPGIWDHNSPAVWSIIYNRFLIGVVIGLAGFMTKNPIFNFKIPAWLRGIKIGILVSVPMAINSLMIPNMESSELWKIFWMTILAGAIYGLIIDVVASKFGGQGKELIE